jgi:hypothetical protein
MLTVSPSRIAAHNEAAALVAEFIASGHKVTQCTPKASPDAAAAATITCDGSIGWGSRYLASRPRAAATFRNSAYDITVRRLATGCDYTMRLFAFDAHEAGNRAMDRARFSDGMRRSKYIELNAKGIAVYRVVSCEVSADQARPIS